MTFEEAELIIGAFGGALGVILLLYAFIASRGRTKGGYVPPPGIPDTDEARWWYYVRFGGDRPEGF